MSIDQEFKAMVKDAVNEELLPLKRALSRLEALVALRVEPLAEEKAATPKKKKKEKKVQLSSFASTKKAAQFFGVHRSTMLRWINANRLSSNNDGWIITKVYMTEDQRRALLKHLQLHWTLIHLRAANYLQTGKIDWQGPQNFVSVAGQTVAKKKEVYKTSFADVKEAAKFFGVNPSTIRKWFGSDVRKSHSGFLNAEWDLRKNKWTRITSTSEQRVKLTFHISKTSALYMPPRAGEYLKTGKIPLNKIAASRSAPPPCPTNTFIF